MARFEVYNQAGNLVFQTDYEETRPTDAQIRAMAALGYKFKLGGKAWKPQKGGR